ncbi:MAG TPA: ATP-binding protein [Chloroflexia bacterium]|nr:ATP-binding protein [Chloroflexia bacterium]
MLDIQRLLRIIRPLASGQRWVDRLVTEVAITSPAARAGGARYALTLLALGAVTAGFWPIKESAGLLNIGLVFLIVVVGATAFGGRGPGRVAAVVGFLLFDFFLVPPYLTLAIGDLHNILALVVFLGLSVLINTLIGRAREETAQAARRAGDLQRLYTLGQVALRTLRREALLPALVAQVVEMVEAEAGWLVLLDVTGSALRVAARMPPDAPAPTAPEWDAVQQVFAHAARGPGLGAGAATRPRTLLAPLAVRGRVLGVLGVTAGPRPRPFAAAEQTVLATLADQVALALDRLDLQEEADRAEVLERTDALKSALLHAVSHDLRTPLASIKATVTSLLDPAIQWEAITQREFLEGVDEECDRLTRLVGNLLDMSRIEGGAVRLDRDWYPIGEVIATVRRRLAARLADHPLEVTLPPDLPLVPLDFVKIDGVLTNLLENAIRYTPPGTPIQVRAGAWQGVLAVTVADTGSGVAPQHLAHLFDKFYRVAGSHPPQGSGLGLAIAQGMVQAHGGTISARSAPGQGLTITFTLPLALPDPAPPPAARAGSENAEAADGR